MGDPAEMPEQSEAVKHPGRSWQLEGPAGRDAGRPRGAAGSRLRSGCTTLTLWKNAVITCTGWREEGKGDLEI